MLKICSLEKKSQEEKIFLKNQNPQIMLRKKTPKQPNVFESTFITKRFTASPLNAFK